MTLIEKASNKSERFVIALDGPSASGKGLIGSMLAAEFSLAYVQSSIVYRGLAYICQKEGINISEVDKIIQLSKDADIFSLVKGVDLNTELIGDMASKLSVIAEVRKNLGRYLKEIIKTTERIIMEGRDIGTVIAPDADLKLFITANVDVRAARRYKQLLLEGKECILDDVLDLLKVRDERDKSRKTAPLVPALDAYIIDTSDLSPDQVVQKVKDIISKSS